MIGPDGTKAATTMCSSIRASARPDQALRLSTRWKAAKPGGFALGREGVCASVLRRRHRRARKDAGLPAAAAAQRLLPVRVAAPAPAEPARPAAGLEAVLGNGRVPRIPPGAGPALVAQMAAVLERQAGGRRGQAASAAALPPGADGAGAVAHAAGRSGVARARTPARTWRPEMAAGDGGVRTVRAGPGRPGPERAAHRPRPGR